ncbi:MAG: cob(I)yrinic acid a,c-diamide adenosyltransferase [Patescibacteria group bacterium]
MPIYTKTGDRGHTSIFGGRRVSKSHPQVRAYGTIDELSSQIGLVTSKLTEDERQPLIQIQKDLWQMMGLLAGAEGSITPIEKEIKSFEGWIDKLEGELPKLTRFVLPGGTELASWFHILRTTARRAERETVDFFLSETPHNITEENEGIMLRYLNRLSDLFFMLARSHAQGTEIQT